MPLFPYISMLKKEPPQVFYKKNCLSKFRNIHRKTPLLESFLIKLQALGLLKKRLQDRCFPVNIAKFLRAPILKNICEQLLLMLTNIYLNLTFEYHYFFAKTVNGLKPLNNFVKKLHNRCLAGRKYASDWLWTDFCLSGYCISILSNCKYLIYKFLLCTALFFKNQIFFF